MDKNKITALSFSDQHQDCLLACQQVIRSEPENPLPWKFAGKSLLALRQFEKAQQYLTKAHQLDTKDPETTKDIGNIFLNLGRTEDATEWYKKSLNINNNYAPAINNLAIIKRQSGNNKEACDLFKSAIQADQRFIQAYVGAAKCFLTLKDFDQAKSFAIRAIEINANAPEINEILGIIFQAKKNYQQAVECYQNELAINPKSKTSLVNLGSLLLEQGEAEAAIEPLAKAAAIIPGEQCSLQLAQAYQNIGKLKEAIIEYKKIDISKTQNKLIPFNLGLCLLNTGSSIDSIQAFKLAIKIDESFLPAWGNIGTALIKEGRHHEALPATLKVLELDTNNPTAHMNLGSIYKKLGNHNQALASTLKSIELKPDNPTAHTNLGAIYMGLGKFDKALESTLKSLELKPDNHDALTNLGDIYRDLGNLDQALASTLKSLELKPDNDRALINLAKTYQLCDQCEKAIDAVMKAIEINNSSENAYLVASDILCSQKLFSNAREMLERGQAITENNHMIQGELIRVKFLEGLFDDSDDNKPWGEDDDIYFEDCDGSALIISFGSNGRLREYEKNMPLFNFRDTLQTFTNYDKLYIRDLDRRYYLKGIRNSAPSIIELRELLLRYTSLKPYKSIVTLGASSGGFGALLYGNLIKAEKMIAFNPQTVLDIEKDTIIKDDTFAIGISKMLNEMQQHDPFYRKCLNLKNFIPFHGKAVIHCSSNSTGGVDKRYAEHLSHHRCRIVAHESSTHLLALELKEKNMLATEISKSINSYIN